MAVRVRPRIVVGLGNPGPKYEATRHNAGFWFADRLAARLGAVFRPERRFQAEACEAAAPAGRVRIVKPATYMNRSGQTVGAVAGYFRIEPAAILVVHDELDLPPGAVRLKEGGGHGGHNGLRDVTAHLGSRDFVRVRLGIGRPGRGWDAIDYVLARPGAEDRRLIDEAIERVLERSGELLAGDLQPAMKALHTKQDEGPPSDGGPCPPAGRRPGNAPADARGSGAGARRDGPAAAGLGPAA